MNLTVRDIPETVIAQIRALAVRERRSLNSQLLTVIENGLTKISPPSGTMQISTAAQLELWQGLSGRWQDQRSARVISEEITGARTRGRKVTFDSP